MIIKISDTTKNRFRSYCICRQTLLTKKTKLGWGCAARFPKPLQNSVIFSTLFHPEQNVRYPIFDQTLNNALFKTCPLNWFPSSHRCFCWRKNSFLYMYKKKRMHNARLEYKTHTPFKDKMANIDTLKRLKNHCQVTPSTSKRKREKNWTVTRALANVPFYSICFLSWQPWPSYDVVVHFNLTSLVYYWNIIRILFKRYY